MTHGSNWCMQERTQGDIIVTVHRMQGALYWDDSGMILDL